MSDRLAITLRCLLAIVGGYVASTLAYSALGVGLGRLGVARGEAMALGSLLAPLLYLVILVWAFHDDRLGRIASVLAVVSGLALSITALAGKTAA